MKRQNVRSFLIILSMLLLPLTQFYFSPVLIFAGAFTGIVVGSALLFAVLFIGGIFVGRAFCGWVMPCGGLQECFFSFSGKPARGGRLNWIKYCIWLPWLGAVIGAFFSAGGIYSVDPLAYTWHGISISQPWMYIIYYSVVAIFLVFSLLFGRRAGCHYLCWMAPFMVLGRKLGRLIFIPGLHLRADSSACASCNRCTKECPMSIDVMAKVQSGAMYDAECILCAKCADSCPKKAVTLTFGIDCAGMHR